MTLFYVMAGLVFLFSLAVRQKLQATYSRWSRVRSATGLAGARVARTILDSNELRAVRVEPARGRLTDHYDPRRKRVRLSEQNFVTNSVAATAVAAHECGHAIQDGVDYGPMELRTALAPVSAAAARFGLPLALGGWLFGSPTMVKVGILAYVGSILLVFLTLPVEFNASKRALAQLDQLGLVSEDGHEGAKEVLRAAAMTYVAGVASSAGYLVYLVFIGARWFIARPKPLPPGL